MVSGSRVPQTAVAVARFRAESGKTQAAIAEKAGLDQSRVSRIEKGEVAAPSEVDRVLDALAALGVLDELGLHRGVWTRRFARRRTTTNVVGDVGARDARRWQALCCC